MRLCECLAPKRANGSAFPLVSANSDETSSESHAGCKTVEIRFDTVRPRWSTVVDEANYCLTFLDRFHGFEFPGWHARTAEDAVFVETLTGSKRVRVSSQNMLMLLLQEYTINSISWANSTRPTGAAALTP